MPAIRPSSPNSPSQSPLGAGCLILFALAFIVAGLQPLWVFLTNPAGTGDYFGENPVFPIVIGALAFSIIGLYLLIVFIRAARDLPPIQGRVFANITLFLLAIPFHWWLFFGKTAQSSLAVSPGGLTIAIPFDLPASFLLKKIVVASICLIIDLILVSEIFGLGWFTWQAGPPSKDS